MNRQQHILWITVLACVLCARPLVAQGDADSSGGVVTGYIADASTGAAIAGATVVLELERAAERGARSAVTDAEGAYRFTGVAGGVYRLYASSLGYRPFSIVVAHASEAQTPVALALVPQPIELPAVEPRSQRMVRYGKTQSSDDADAARAAAIEQRRRMFLTTDARELTHADVVESITLGEPDVLRALQRLPGVSTRSDYTAELWTRGAPWSQTRVYFDGVPLFNPLHALGVVSGVGSSAIGAAWFHPGVRSAGLAEGAAGVVELHSRRAQGDGELNAHGDLSFVSASAAFDQRILDGRAGWMLSARRTYLDWLTGMFQRAADRDGALPYGFSEIAGQLDAWVGEVSSVDASWLWERDHLQGEAASDARTDWGNRAARVGFTTRVRGFDVRHNAAASAYDARMIAQEEPVVMETLSRNGTSGVSYLSFSGVVTPQPDGVEGPAWSVGYALERRAVRYDGTQVLPVPRLSIAAQASAETEDDDRVRVRWSSALPQLALWGERNITLVERLHVRAGARMEAGERVANGGEVRVAPRVSMRYDVAPALSLSAGAARVYQYLQTVAPTGIYLASLASADAWLIAGEDVPAVRADIATLGLETQLAPHRSATINAYARHATGLTAPDPSPGRIFDRPTFVPGTNTAYGVELSVRQTAGSVTGALSYTLGTSEQTAAGMTYAAASDRRHVLDAQALVRATRALRVGAAFTAATGVPFTRTAISADECALMPGCTVGMLPWMGAPNAERAATFASLDLLADYSTRIGGVDIGVYAQLRNALDRDNTTVYIARSCANAECGADLRTRSERGVPRMPVIGLRVGY